MQTVPTNFRTSTFCASGACVEIAFLDDDKVAVRDSKTPAADPQIYTHDEWNAFVAGVKAGEFDLRELDRVPRQTRRGL